MIDTPNRRKQKRVCHVNLLKLYRRRDEKQFPNSANAATVNVATVVPENDVGVTIPALSDLKTSTPSHTKNEYLTQLQQTELDKLLANYADIFSDTPGKTFLATHHPPHLNGPKRLNSFLTVCLRIIRKSIVTTSTTLEFGITAI